MNLDNFNQKDDFNNNINLKEEIFKYLSFWPWFLISLTFFIFLSFIYLRYTPNTYKTVAKIKILDEKEGLELPSASTLFSKSNINLENEIESIKSYPILDKVTKSLNLTNNFYEVGRVKTRQIIELPFDFQLLIPIDSINSERVFDLIFNNKLIKIKELDSDLNIEFDSNNTIFKSPELPFSLSNLPKNIDGHFRIRLNPIKSVINELKKKLDISSIGKESEVIKISLESQNISYSENIINTLIDIYNNDGIEDRRLIHKRTVDFINERFITLGYELDSIELNKQTFFLIH